MEDSDLYWLVPAPFTSNVAPYGGRCSRMGRGVKFWDLYRFLISFHCRRSSRVEGVRSRDLIVSMETSGRVSIDRILMKLFFTAFLILFS